MSKPTVAQIEAAEHHVVTVLVDSHDAVGHPFTPTITGLVADVFTFGEGNLSFNLMTDRDTGLQLMATEVADWTDHGPSAVSEEAIVEAENALETAEAAVKALWARAVAKPAGEDDGPTCPECDAPLTHVGATCPNQRLSAHR